MNEGANIIVLEHLRHIRASVDDLKCATSTCGSERLSIRNRADSKLDRIKARLDRVERRLDLAD